MSYYRYHVFFCTNQRGNGEACCQQYDAQVMRDYAKQQVKQKGLSEPGMARINNAGCLNRCAEGPVLVIYPEAVWYTWVDQNDIDEIIDSHLGQGKIVERLRLPG
jgi:(2Fe-2S) ferredoxin